MQTVCSQAYASFNLPIFLNLTAAQQHYVIITLTDWHQNHAGQVISTTINYPSKAKGTIFPVHVITSALHGGEWLTSRPGRFTPHPLSGCSGEAQNFPPERKFDPRTVQPVT
jgi:hypothetical protein